MPSNYVNAFEQQLSSSVGPTDLTFNVASTSDSPASPCWLVIDPYDDAKREYVYFDGTFTATTLTTSTINNRYGAGSAAISGLTHDEGAIVLGALTKQLLDEIVTEIGEKAALVHDHDPAGGAPLTHYVTQDAGELDSYSEEYLSANGGLATSINLATTLHRSITLNAANCVLSFSGFVAGRLTSMNLRLIQDASGGRTVTWPATVQWPGKAEPMLSTAPNAIDNFVIRSWDGGTTIEAFMIGQNMGVAP